MRDRIIEWSGFALVLTIGIAIAAFGSGYQAQTLFTAALFILLATGWNVISGFTGYVSFGQVSFFGVGAYVGALAMIHLDAPWYGAAAVAALGGIVLALPLGWVMLRLQGIFFALGMFGLARILQIVASSLDITGGAMGTTVAVADSVNECALVMVLAAGAALVGTYALMRTRLGLRLMALRDDAVAAQAAGVDTAAVRVTAFCISAGLGAVGGALYVWNVGYLDPNSAFNGTIELQTVLMVLAGGIGTVWGPLVGGVLISLLSTALWARFPMEQQIVLGALTMGIAVAMPGGIMAALGRIGIVRRQPICAPDVAAPAEAAPAAEAAARGGGPILSCRSLGVAFGGVVAVKGVSIEARPAEMLAVIGPNGAGKSTLFNLISGFTRATQGDVVFAGETLAALHPHLLARSGIARTFQTSRLFRSLCVWETVLLAAASVGRSRAAAMAETRRILAEIGLWEQWADLPDTLPPGRQRLLEIARALALRPRVLLLDEAMAGMSAQEIERVHAALRGAMRRGCSIVAIEHVLPAIAPLAARVHVLDFGQTIAEGVPHQVMNDPVVIEAYMGVDDQEPVHGAA